MAKTIVAMFGSRAEADQAAEILMDQGFDRGEIDVRSEAASASAAGESQSWWEWLFGQSEERNEYSEGLRQGGAVLSVTTSDERAERACWLLEAEGGEVEQGAAERGRESGRTGTAAGAAGATAAGGAPQAGQRERQDEEVVPIVEERLRVGKRPAVRGGVRIYSRVTEEPVEEQVRLREERVHIERRPADRPVAGQGAFREDEFEMIETTEEPVVAKEARVVEEVSVSKDVDEHVETVRDTVRRTDVDVEPIGQRGAESPAYQRNEGDFRRHWQTIGAGRPYEECRPGYEYGCRLGSDPRHAARDWSAVEIEAQRDWEQRNPGTWQDFREPVRYAWEQTRGSDRRAA